MQHIYIWIENKTLNISNYQQYNQPNINVFTKTNKGYSFKNFPSNSLIVFTCSPLSDLFSYFIKI